MSLENLPFPAYWLWGLYLLYIAIYNHYTFARGARYVPSPINGLAFGGGFTLGLLGIFGIINVSNGAQVLVIITIMGILGMLAVPETYIEEQKAKQKEKSNGR